MTKCQLCDEACTDLLCGPCRRSLDKFLQSKRNRGDSLSLIAWAAGRGRMIERRRAHKAYLEAARRSESLAQMRGTLHEVKAWENGRDSTPLVRDGDRWRCVCPNTRFAEEPTP